MSRPWLSCVALMVWGTLGLHGCASLGPSPGMVSNPLYVRTNFEEAVFERAVDVLHEYHFEIARENRIAHQIETRPRVGSGLLEPWHADSVGFENRLESTLQSIRRRVLVNIVPDRQNGNGYLVAVEAYKELEHVHGLAANSPGAATFSESTPLQKDLNPVVGQSGPSEWIPLGRDVALEQSLLQSLSTAYSR